MLAKTLRYYREASNPESAHNLTVKSYFHSFHSFSRLNEKSYKRMDKFSGGENEWNEWKYDFMIITRSVNKKVGETLEACIKGKKPVSTESLQSGVDDTAQPGEAKQ